MAIGAKLKGDMRAFGETDLHALGSDLVLNVFVIAYELSKEAVEQALR